MKNETKKCPHCAEEILAEAKICKHCGKKIKTKGLLLILSIIMFITFASLISALSDDPSTSNNSTTPDNSEALIMAENFTEKHLKYPSDSKFPRMGGEIINNGNIYTVTNYVDAANGFGAKQRTYYTIKLKYKGGNWAESGNWSELEFNFKE